MIKVYSKPKCVQCEMTKEFLKSNNVKFKEVNVFEDEEALELIKSHGFQIDLLDELVEK